jgi:diguanylate cyclase (GGDEF)-like protein
VWSIFVASIVLIAAVSYLAFPVTIGPLYVLPIWLACWRIGLGAGLGGAVGTAVLHSATSVLHLNSSIELAALNVLTHATGLSILVGIMVSFRQRFEGERNLARLDRLTGALTRYAFEDKADEILAAAGEDGRPLLLAFLDLDGFKAVNDEYGHCAGDRVLQRVGVEATMLSRRGACIGRVGGDEFAVLMWLSSVEVSKAAALSLHARFTKALASTHHPVTCSIGALVVLPKHGATLGELLFHSDRVMYLAKRNGKNNVYLERFPPPLEADLVIIAPAAELLRRSPASAA